MGDLYIHEACNKGNIKWLKELVAAGQDDPKVVDAATGGFPLHWAARGAHVECAKFLLEEKLNEPDCKNLAGNTPLHFATISGTKKVAQLLVEHGADINAQNVAGQTPLQGAVSQNWDHVVTYLAGLRDDEACKDCKRGKCKKHILNLNAQDENGMTALHYASRSFSSGMYSLLLRLGADSTLKNKAGELPKSPSQGYREFAANYGAILMVALAMLAAYAYNKLKDFEFDWGES